MLVFVRLFVCLVQTCVEVSLFISKFRVLNVPEGSGDRFGQVQRRSEMGSQIVQSRSLKYCVLLSSPSPKSSPPRPKTKPKPIKN